MMMTERQTISKRRTAWVELILAESYRVSSFFELVRPFWDDGVVGAHFAQYPNRDHKMPPKIPPASTGSPEDIPEATCTSTVPGQAPVSAIPQPRSNPPMMFPSYRFKRFKLEVSRGLQGAIFARLHISMKILFDELA